MKSNNWIYATPAQESYLRRLWSEVAQYRTAKWARPSNGRKMLKSEASREIEMLLSAIAEGKAKNQSVASRVGATQGEFLNAMAGL